MIPDDQTPPPSFAIDEIRRLEGYVGTRATAPALFRAKIPDDQLHACGVAILEGLDFRIGTNGLYSDFRHMSDRDVADWGIRCWANTIAHLARSDAQVREVLRRSGGSYLPNDAGDLDVLLQKVNESFVFFLWILAGPDRPIVMDRSCYVKMIVLSDAILLENIQAKKDGQTCGWDLLDHTITGLRAIAEAFGIRTIKAIATNERVYRAFLRRGFCDQPEIEGLDRQVSVFAKPTELLL